MQAIKRLILGLVLLMAVLAAVAFALPRHITLARSAVINAPESDVFLYVNDFRKFNEWSPWAAIDPNTQYEFSGPESGKGARMAWKSDHPNVGSGSQEIVDSQPNSYVEVALDFGIEGKGTASYRLAPSGAGTKITWGFETDVGHNPLMRWMGLLIARWVAQDYDKGLANLKKTVES